LTKDELAYWLSVVDNSRFKWTEDAIFRLNGRGSFYYTGGENGVYMKVGKDGMLEAGTYEGAVPHIGEAMFKPETTRQCADYNEAFTVIMEAGGKKFLMDMLSADAPAMPAQAEKTLDEQLAEEGPERSGPKPPIRAYIVNEDDLASMFGDIDRMRNREYKGVWLDFPTTREAVQAALMEIGVDGVQHGAFTLNKFETDIGALRQRLHIGADIDEINYLAHRLQNEVSPQNLAVFAAVMESGRHCERLRDIINVTENLDCFYIQPAYSLEQYADFLKDLGRDEHGAVIARLENTNEEGLCALPSYIDRLEKYFDAEAYARDVVAAENGVFTESGYLTEHGEFVELYNGRHDMEIESVMPDTRLLERKLEERPSALDRLAAAKDTVAKADAEKPAAPKDKYRDAEL
jgi:hypothetical protein